MKDKKFLKPVDPKYSEIFKVWNEPRVDYQEKRVISKKARVIKVLLHPLSILFMITTGMVIYTFRLLFVR